MPGNTLVAWGLGPRPGPGMWRSGLAAELEKGRLGRLVKPEPNGMESGEKAALSPLPTVCVGKAAVKGNRRRRGAALGAAGLPGVGPPAVGASLWRGCRRAVLQTGGLG